ncbi:MAG TPA: tetratricopeptide repeat protein [Anaerolineae bacterium]|nr:tetratricopeptide repeat protein [Anaerolineae bacterium]
MSVKSTSVSPTQHNIDDIIAQVTQLQAQINPLLRTDTNQAETLLNTVTNTLPQTDNPQIEKLRAINLGLRARLKNNTGHYDEAIQYGLEALTILETIGNKRDIPPILHALGISYRILGNLSESLAYRLRQLELCKELGDQDNYARVLTGLGVIYNDMGDYDRTLSYFHQSLEVFEKIGDSYWLALLRNNISDCHLHLGNVDQAIQYGLESLSIAKDNNHENMIVVVSNTLGEIFLTLKDWNNASLHLRNALDLMDTAHNPNHKVDTLKLLGILCLRQDDTAQALTYLHQAEELAEKIQNKQYLYKIYEALSETYETAQDTDQALTYYKKFHQIKESVFNAESNQKMQNLEVLHRTESAQKEAAHYADLYASEQARNELMHTLNQVGRALTSTLEMEAVLNKILDQLARLIQFDRGALLLWKHDDFLQLKATWGAWPDHITLDSLFWIDLDETDFPLVEVQMGQRPLPLPTTTNHTTNETWGPFFGHGAWLGLPLVHQDRVLGMLTLARDNDDPYAQETITTVTTFITQAAVTIVNAQLYAQSKRRADEMTTLTKVGEDILSSLNLSHVLDRIAHHAHQLFHAFQTILWLRSNDGETLQAIAAMGKYTDQFLADTVYLGEGIAGTIAQTGQPEIINDSERDRRGKHVPGTPQQEDTPASIMCAPIMVRDRPIGVMSLYRDKTLGWFDENDLNFLMGLTRQAAVAIENAKLYDQVRRFNTQLEKEVARRTEDLQAAYAQLERLDKTKSDFIAVTAHELRTPITVLKGYGQLLERDPLLADHQYQSNLATGIVTGANRLLEIVNTMLTMIKADSQSLTLNLAPLNLYSLLKKIVKNLTDDIEARDQQIFITSGIKRLPDIYADRESLTMVFSNLVINAIKYTPDGGQITITGRSWQSAPRPDWPFPGLEIVVSDTGIGIPTPSLDLIFTKFYQTGEVANHSSGKTQFKAGGPGLGLAICRGIIQAHGGLIWADSDGYDEETLPGSDFHVILPLDASQPQSEPAP